MLKLIKDFLSYWYFRYLLVTELYMVEKWERVMFHVVLLMVFSILYVFNTFAVIEVLKILQISFWQNDPVSLVGASPSN